MRLDKLDRPDRWAAILGAEQSWDAETVSKVLTEWWPDVEFPSSMDQEQLLGMFWRAGYVSDTEDRLEGQVTIYRGADSPWGLSWTLDRQRAEWFAQRGALMGDDTQVYETTIDAAHILGYFTGRDEAEVLINPELLRGQRIRGEK